MHKEREDGETVTHLTEIEARSGSRTRMNRNILIVSLVLVAILLAFALAFGFFETDRSGADGVNADAQQHNATR